MSGLLFSRRTTTQIMTASMLCVHSILWLCALLPSRAPRSPGERPCLVAPPSAAWSHHARPPGRPGEEITTARDKRLRNGLRFAPLLATGRGGASHQGRVGPGACSCRGPRRLRCCLLGQSTHPDAPRQLSERSELGVCSFHVHARCW